MAGQSWENNFGRERSGNVASYPADLGVDEDYIICPSFLGYTQTPRRLEFTKLVRANTGLSSRWFPDGPDPQTFLLRSAIHH